MNAVHKEPSWVPSCSVFAINNPEDHVTYRLITPQKKNGALGAIANALDDSIKIPDDLVKLKN